MEKRQAVEAPWNEMVQDQEIKVKGKPMRRYFSRDEKVERRIQKTDFLFRLCIVILF